MKQIVRICALLLVLILATNPGITVHAAGTVSYDGDADKFIFAPGSDHSPTDLFSDLKNVMPGDSVSQEIFIRNGVSNNVKIKVYMRSLGAQEGTDAFLSQMNLSVQQEGNSVLFAAPANETAQLTDWVYLGTVYSGGEITLGMTLEVPITMGNEFQNQVGYLDWQFKIEELPVEPSDPQPPKTGDASAVFLYAGLMTVSLIAVVILFFTGKRRKQRVEE